MTEIKDLKNRIARALEAAKSRGLSQGFIAREIGIKPQAVSQWKTGKAEPTRDNLIGLANITGVDLEWLTTGDETEFSASNTAPVRKPRGRAMPKYTIDQIGKGMDRQSPDKAGEPAERVHSYYACSRGSFALELTDASMQPEFHAGDTVIIDPAIGPEPGDYVCARFAGVKQATFRIYRHRGFEKDGTAIIELAPMNDDWATLHINKDNPGEIVGTMSEHIRPRRPR